MIQVKVTTVISLGPTMYRVYGYTRPAGSCWDTCMCEGHNSTLTQCTCSFIPRQFPPSVFDRLQYANMEGKAWEIRSCVVTSGRQRVDRWGVVPNWTVIIPALHWPVPGVVNTWCCLAKNLASSQWTDIFKSFSILCWTPPSVCLCKWHLHRWPALLSFPSCLCNQRLMVGMAWERG